MNCETPEQVQSSLTVWGTCSNGKKEKKQPTKHSRHTKHPPSEKEVWDFYTRKQSIIHTKAKEEKHEEDTF